VYWFCTKFGLLILRKIIKIVANRCQILRPKCTKFDFGLGSPRLDSLAVFRESTSKGERMRGRGGRAGGDGRGGVDQRAFAEMTPLFRTSVVSHSKPSPARHCKLLPPGEFNVIIPEPLAIMTAGTVFP